MSDTPCADCQPTTQMRNHHDWLGPTVTKLCPKHASVDALIAALRGVHRWNLKDSGYCWCHKITANHIHSPECLAARAALKSAGEEV